MKKETVLRKAKDAILSCIDSIPFIRNSNIEISPRGNESESDLLISVTIKDQPLSIIAQVKSSGEPRYARQAVSRLVLDLQESNASYGIFVAPYISERAAAICEENGIGSLDLAGNCRLSFNEVFIQIKGNPNPFKREKYLRSMFAPKAERILRVMLNTGPKRWKVEEMANEAEVSLGQVSNVKSLLEDQEWLGEGLSLKNWKELLAEWTKNYKYRQNEVFSYYVLLDSPEFEENLNKYCQENDITYGFTGFSGAARIAPTVRYQRVMAYVDGNIEKISNNLGMKSVSSGANVLLLKPYDAGVFYGANEIGNARVVSPIQIYLDLMSYRGRGEEAAEAILDKVIGEKW